MIVAKRMPKVSKTSLNLNEANPQIEIQENLTRSLLLVLHSAAIAVYTDTTVYLAAHVHPRHNTSNT